MKTDGGRKYQVASVDFPLQIEIRAINLAVNRAVVSDVRVSRDGVLVETTTPALTTDQDQRLITYQIARPTQAPPLHVTQTIEGFFANNAPDNARYEIVITAASGDKAPPTSIRVPSINPGAAHLTFQFS